MAKILSLGAGVQSTALLILASRGLVECDKVIFADTGVEKPTTYEMLPVLKDIAREAGFPFLQVSYTGDGWDSLYDYCKKRKIMPSVINRWCTDKFKVRPIAKVIDRTDEVMIGFSLDERHRAKLSKRIPYLRTYPLIDLGLTVDDCRYEIQQYGLPLPTKSACYCCPFQHPTQWKWLKSKFPELFARALEIEELTYERKPESRHLWGLFRGKPLWKAMAEGAQAELPFEENFGCNSGHCFH